MKLNLFPKVKVHYPTTKMGQLYIPIVNTFLYFGCVGVVLYFRESRAMEGAYGFCITVAMLATSFLLLFYNFQKGWGWKAIVFYVIYVIIEGSFLFANSQKLLHGGAISVVVLFTIAYILFDYNRVKSFKKALVKKLQHPIEDLLTFSKSIRSGYDSDILVLMQKENNDSIDSRFLDNVIGKGHRSRMYIVFHVENLNIPSSDQVNTLKKIGENYYIINVFKGFKDSSNMGDILRILLDDYNIVLPTGFNPVNKKPLVKIAAIKDNLPNNVEFLFQQIDKLSINVLDYYWPGINESQKILEPNTLTIR